MATRRRGDGEARMVCRRRSCRDQAAQPAGSAAGAPGTVGVAADWAVALAAGPAVGFLAAASSRGCRP